jgi:pimeloyl-ACP methyl ester carboxylesterase
VNVRDAWGRLSKDERRRFVRRWSLRVVGLLLGAALFAAGCEEVLERRARERLTQGETFAQVNGARIRYRLLGAEHAGPTVVFLAGLGGSIEQMVYVQARVAKTARTLAYDRGGYGFSVGSEAHTAEQQTVELDGLLAALHLDGPVVLLGFSTSASIARVFAARYPERTRGLYLVEPYFPEIEKRVAGRKEPRRVYIRWIVHDFFTSTFGLKRLSNRLASYAGPDDPVEQRAEEVLQSRRHFLALAAEWYVTPQIAEQATRAPVGREPMVILFTGAPDPSMDRALGAMYEEFVAHSPEGKVVKLANHDHSKLLTPGPVLDTIVQGLADVTERARGPSTASPP